MLVCDTSGLVAFFDADDAHHDRVGDAVATDPGPFVVSPYVLAEVDRLLAVRVGVRAELAVLRELSGGAWDLPCLEAAELRQARDVLDRYWSHEIDLADASLVVLAARYRTNRLLSLDHHRLAPLRTLDGQPFELVPPAGG